MPYTTKNNLLKTAGLTGFVKKNPLATAMSPMGMTPIFDFKIKKNLGTPAFSNATKKFSGSSTLPNK